jgi:Fungal specific transcription factor domain
MHHYTLHTAGSLIQDSEMRQLWQSRIPEEATSYPFLMQGLLALSALHLAYQHPSKRSMWIRLSLKHQDTALASFRSTLPSLNKDNCHALFALSAIVSLTSFSSVIYDSLLHPGGTILLKDIIKPFLLIRGNASVLHIAFDWIRQGPLALLLDGHRIPYYPQDLPASTEQQFSNMYNMARSMSSDPTVEQVLVETLQSLKRIYKEAIHTQGAANRKPGMVWKWAIMVSQDYVTLLQDSHPGALVIFAHFAVLSKAFKDEWYLQGWPELALSAISNALDPSWRGLVSWPEDQTKEALQVASYHDNRGSEFQSHVEEIQPSHAASQSCDSQQTGSPLCQSDYVGSKENSLAPAGKSGDDSSHQTSRSHTDEVAPRLTPISRSFDHSTGPTITQEHIDKVRTKNEGLKIANARKQKEILASLAPSGLINIGLLNTGHAKTLAREESE